MIGQIFNQCMDRNHIYFEWLRQYGVLKICNFHGQTWCIGQYWSHSHCWSVLCLTADVRRLCLCRYDSVQFQLAGNDVIEWRHRRAAGTLLAGMFSGHRLRNCHISSDGRVFDEPRSWHGRQLSVRHFCSVLLSFLRSRRHVFAIYTMELCLCLCSVKTADFWHMGYRRPILPSFVKEFVYL